MFYTLINLDLKNHSRNQSVIQKVFGRRDQDILLGKMDKYVREMLPSLIKISEKQQQQNLSNRSNKLSINFV